jgi:hypothetical protein
MNAAPGGLARLALCFIALSPVADGANTGALLREAQKLPEIAAPPGGQALWIARAMRLNGVPMTIKSFHSPMNAAEVLRHYERDLRTGANLETKRTHEHSWHVLAVMAPSYYVTIRARDTSRGAEGTITVTPALAGLSATKRTSFPHPHAMRVVNLQQYDDDGIEAEHISLVSRRSVAIEARELEELLARNGWHLLRSERAARKRGDYIIEAQKHASHAFVNLQRMPRSGDTSIIVVWRKA